MMSREITYGIESDNQVLAATTLPQVVTWNGGPVIGWYIYNISGQQAIYEPDVDVLDANSMRIANNGERLEFIRCTTVCIQLATGTGNVYLRGWR
jgi:hypothetical protein